jgi:hypothetical protein
MFNPYLGHEPQVYVRERESEYHPYRKNEYGYDLKIGDNMPLFFKLNGSAATVVGPGPKGVGDKIGERDERSVAYDDLLAEYGELYG